MTSQEQDAVIDRLATEHGATRVKPLNDILEWGPAWEPLPVIAVCGWENDWAGYTDPATGETVSIGRRLSPWIIVTADGTETELLDTPEETT